MALAKGASTYESELSSFGNPFCQHGLNQYDQVGFDDVILETVGIGQTSYQAKLLVDTFALVLIPGSGDIIQAMKAGIMELADIYVINKCDLPGADKVAAELRSLVEWRAAIDGWTPPIIMTSVRDSRGFDQLSEAIDAHRRLRGSQARPIVQRRIYQVKSLISQRVAEIPDPQEWDELARAYREIAGQIP